MDPLEINQITFAVQFSYNNNQREVACALIDQDRRCINITEFADNEHFSTFESVLLQTNPMQQNETHFTLLCLYPEQLSERDKVNDLFAQCDFEVVAKERKDFTVSNSLEQMADFVLLRPLRQFVLESACTKAMSCVQVLLAHLGLAKDQSNSSQFTLEFLSLNRYMKLDLAAINALMIMPKAGIDQRFASLDNSQNMTLVEYLNRCKTQMGTRCLRRWIKMPLQDADEINKRLSVVEFLIANKNFLQYLQDQFLKKIPDLDRLYAKFYKVKSEKKHNAGLGDCLKVYQLVVNMRNLVNYANKSTFKNIGQDGNHNNYILIQLVLNEVIIEPLTGVIDDFQKFEKMIEQSIDLQKAYHNEFIVNPKFSASLMELSKSMQKSLESIEQVRQRTSRDLGIDVSLCESGNHTFVFEANKKYADDAFRKNGARRYKTLTVKKGQLTFTLEELQQEVVEYTNFRQEYESEQKEVISKILKIVSGYYPAMERASQCISEIDVYCSFAQVTEQAPRKFIKPIISNQTSVFILNDCRHPLLELVDSNCIVNDLNMDHQESRLHIITGPNMGGKSTFIRQIAICALMAHIGCFVPCSYAQLPVLDAIITRVGASDMQLRGISTFMSEMLEASCMIKTATPRSLIIIDELGRGTSTSEGFGIAWAIAEYISITLQSWCLFATHFHEMTMMENEIQGTKNYHVSCLTADNKITMQYKVKQGAVDRSYGLLVAEMLKFPQEVIDDAKKKALELENFNVHKEQNEKDSDSQIEEEMQFDSIEEEIHYYAKKSNISQKEAIIKLSEQNLSQIKFKEQTLALLKQ